MPGNFLFKQSGKFLRDLQKAKERQLAETKKAGCLEDVLPWLREENSPRGHLRETHPHGPIRF